MENSNRGDLLRAIRRQIAEARQGFEQQVDGPYECNVCEASYNHASELLSHVKVAHYRYHFICKDKTCYQVFMKKSELDHHMEEKNKLLVGTNVSSKNGAQKRK